MKTYLSFMSYPTESLFTSVQLLHSVRSVERRLARLERAVSDREHSLELRVSVLERASKHTTGSLFLTPTTPSSQHTCPPRAFDPFRTPEQEKPLPGTCT